VEACNACLMVIGLVKPKPGASDLNYVGADNAMGDDLEVQGLPLIKPPYGTITAINLDTGEFVWQIAHGETPTRCAIAPRSRDSRFRAPASRSTPARW
jgi:quinoprotein glucose dehydrogenase